MTGAKLGYLVDESYGWDSEDWKFYTEEQYELVSYKYKHAQKSSVKRIVYFEVEMNHDDQ